MKVLLFLGSGVSVESGLPEVMDLTNNLFRDSIDSVATEHSGEHQRIRRLLHLLRDIDQYYLKSVAPPTGAIFRSSTSYEDLIYLVRRIAECGDGLLDDAPAGAFADLIEQRAGDLLEGTNREERATNLAQLAVKASQFIQAQVAESLRNDKIRGLDLVVQLAQSR